MAHFDDVGVVQSGENLVLVVTRFALGLVRCVCQLDTQLEFRRGVICRGRAAGLDAALFETVAFVHGSRAALKDRSVSWGETYNSEH